MEKELEELEVAETLEVFMAAFKILRCAAQVLGAITLTLLLPLSLLILGHSFVPDLLFINEFPPKAMEMHNLHMNLRELFLLEAAYITLVLVLLLPSMAAVVFAVACVYTGKELRYAKVMKIVPRVSMRLVLTFFWYCLVVLAYYVAGLVALLGWILMVGMDSVVLSFGVVVIATLCFGVHVYATMVWQVASVASVLEERYGFGAMKKGRELLSGRRGTPLALNFLFLLAMSLIWWCFEKGVVEGDLHGFGVEERSDNAVLLLLLHSALLLMSFLSQSVFYFVCKSFHHEAIDKLALLDHLEAYLGEDGALTPRTGKLLGVCECPM